MTEVRLVRLTHPSILALRNVTNLLAQSSKGETKFTSFISQVSELMELKNFPEEIRESVLKYYASK